MIDEIRQYYQLSNKITDKQIAQNLKGSLGEAIINLQIAKKNFAMAMAKIMPKVLKRFKLIKTIRIKKCQKNAHQSKENGLHHQL